MKKKNAKMGRPPLKVKDRRTRTITLRLKPSEREELKNDAEAKGLSLSSYLRECWQELKKAERTR